MIEQLLEENLIGASVEEIYKEEDEQKKEWQRRLPKGHKFSWEEVEKDPKGDHGTESVRGNWYKTMNYELLHTGGFLRLCTLRGRVYWTAQNESEHTSPDWKIHFSVQLEDIPTAWNVIAALFMEMKCEIGMKATTLSAAQWSPSQRGRELPVYLFRYHSSFAGYMQGAVAGQDHEFYIGPEYAEIYSSVFWFTFITQAESRLLLAGVRSRGVADGDLPLPNCTFASLRNEALFVSLLLL